MSLNSNSTECKSYYLFLMTRTWMYAFNMEKRSYDSNDQDDNDDDKIPSNY